MVTLFLVKLNAILDAVTCKVQSKCNQIERARTAKFGGAPKCRCPWTRAQRRSLGSCDPDCFRPVLLFFERARTVSQGW